MPPPFFVRALSLEADCMPTYGIARRYGRNLNNWVSRLVSQLPLRFGETNGLKRYRAMNKLNLAVKMVLAVATTIWGVAVHADNHAEAVKANPVEFWSCSFRDGKDMDDLNDATAAFNNQLPPNTSRTNPIMM